MFRLRLFLLRYRTRMAVPLFVILVLALLAIGVNRGIVTVGATSSELDQDAEEVEEKPDRDMEDVASCMEKESQKWLEENRERILAQNAGREYQITEKGLEALALDAAMRYCLQ